MKEYIIEYRNGIRTLNRFLSIDGCLKFLENDTNKINAVGICMIEDDTTIHRMIPINEIIRTHKISQL